MRLFLSLDVTQILVLLQLFWHLYLRRGSLQLRLIRLCVERLAQEALAAGKGLHVIILYRLARQSELVAVHVVQHLHLNIKFVSSSLLSIADGLRLSTRWRALQVQTMMNDILSN